MTEKLRCGVIGATGLVGQRLLTLLADHPWFEITALAASARSAGRPYAEAVADRLAVDLRLPARLAAMTVLAADDVAALVERCDFVFCAVDLPKDETRALEERCARAELPVVSNNSACRLLPDVPMVVPEINPDHLAVVEAQRGRLGTRRGFIVVKPNCSIQSYVPALHPLLDLQPTDVVVTTFQAVSGAGRTLAGWPEMQDNVIPFIKGEEEKSEVEPLKLWGRVGQAGIVPAASPRLSAQCVRVPVSDGHLATVSVRFDRATSVEEIRARWAAWVPEPERLGLPLAPRPFLTYLDADDRPQTRLDRDLHRGMGVTVGRLRADPILGFKFVCLSHNTLRGAAGGSVLTAELCRARGLFENQ